MNGAPSKLPDWSPDARRAGSAQRSRFIESYLELVRATARGVASRLPAWVDLDDLVHDGTVGLLDAVEKFDPSRGVRFGTYAAARVRGAILDGLRKKDWRPRSLRVAGRELQSAEGRVASTTGRSPSEEEVASEMGIGLEEYHRLVGGLHGATQLALDDLPPSAHPAVTAEEQLPFDTLERRDLIQALAQEVRGLPERERRVLELYYHERLNMKEVGMVLGVTESRICRLHARAARRLRDALRPRLRAPTASGAPRRIAGRSA